MRRFAAVRVRAAVAAACVAIAAGAGRLPAQAHDADLPPADVLPTPVERRGFLATADTATTWAAGDGNVVLLTGPVTIQIDDATLTAAEGAAVWLEPSRGGDPTVYDAGVALLGGASLTHGGATRSGSTLYVTASVRGDDVRIEAPRREARDASDAPLFRRSLAVRDAGQAAPDVLQPSAADVPFPTTDPTTAPASVSPATRPAASGFNVQIVGSIDAIEGQPRQTFLSRHPTILVRYPDGDYFELRADRVVIFTTLPAGPGRRPASASSVGDVVESVYLEGDVRINYTPPSHQLGVAAADPAAAARRDPASEQRLAAARAMFRPADKAAILTDVVLHTTDPTIGLPVVVRAATMRQISAGEYDATKVTLTQSAFARPSYAIRADKIYVGQTRNAADDGGRRTRFAADNASFQFLGLPLFWLPRVSGEMGGSQIPLRKIRFTNDTRFGTSLLTEWGLLETLGTRHPPGLDASYRLDYYSDRGPGVGFNARYGGSTVTETTRQPWDFEGDFTSYGVYDTGFDQFGGARGRPGTYGPPPDPFKPYPDQDVTRAWIGWRHQHFFPEGWQVQATANYLTDQNFLEQYFESEFDTGGPKSDSLYVKRQDGIQAATFLLDFQPNKFVTTVDLAQEQFEVERYPQVTYHRIGDSWFDDRVTFYSDNSAAALHFQQNRVSLEQQGFALSGTTVPGLPSTGISGTTGETVFRGDARQEVAFPFTIGQFKVVPYVVGRVTAYSESPQGPQRQRLLGAVGARVSTAFWRVDDAVQSDLFDLHRLRHVIEPELHLFASAANVEQGEVYVFDEPVDRVSDIGAAQVAVRQRWQTKRGGPGRWRSVDVFTLDVEANFFNHRPDEAFREPENFRGLFLSSIPEASLPRNSVNAAGAWRISDTTLLISDARYNLDVQDLATASVGLLVQRDARLGYYVGSRYIDPLTSNVTTLGVSYALTNKYSLTVAQSWDFGLNQNVGSTVLLARQFDRFFASVGFQYDAVQEVTSFTLNVYPEGIGFGTGNLASFAGLQRQ